MSRIYFDSNVFSKLRNNSELRFKKLNELIATHKDNLTFTFSIAHIHDKKKDESDHKFEDFRFIETIVSNNYLAYHPTEKAECFYLATPSMVYDDHGVDDFDVKSALDIFKPEEDDDPIMKEAKALMAGVMNIPIPGFSELTKNITEENKAALSKILPVDKSEITLMDFMTSQIDLYREMNTNPETYKDLRKLVDEGLNNGKFTLEDETIDLNTAFKDSAFQKTYLDYVKDSFNKKEGEAIPYYDYFIQAYHCLDLLGISKDKISKKNSYGNLFNDGLHAYFGQFNDYVVSDDKRFKKKTTAVYKLLGISTQVLTVSEFIEILPVIGCTTDKNMMVFFEKLSKDVRESHRHERVQTPKGSYTNIDPDKNYLNFFDVILEIEEDGLTHYFITKKRFHSQSSPNYREQGMILNRCIRIFGPDAERKGEFDFIKEIKEMQQNTWSGRTWRIGSYIATLENNTGSNEFCLAISPYIPIENGETP